ncbi:hypothetical protein CPAV1605_59 [seawater metagenome]|uniref:RING-type domain-containing protein n=1 Tax=seawater metagenome TaxID=1561972 RepID=A0A5E8CH36_9ZZZZ
MNEVLQIEPKLNDEHRIWINVRSDNFDPINIPPKSQDDLFYNIGENIIKCPICYEVMWSETKKLQCNECNKILCNNCLENIKQVSYRNNRNINCPFCRNIIEVVHRPNIRQNIPRMNPGLIGFAAILNIIPNNRNNNVSMIVSTIILVILMFSLIMLGIVIMYYV